MTEKAIKIIFLKKTIFIVAFFIYLHLITKHYSEVYRKKSRNSF